MIWLLRHGDAEPEAGDGDAARPLTKKGGRQASDAGRALAVLGVKIDTCLSSPKLRALESARIACEPLDAEVEIEERLRGGSFDPLELAERRGEVLLVGHEPDFSAAVAELTGARIKLKKGGLAACEPSVLHALYRPKDLTAIAGKPA